MGGPEGILLRTYTIRIAVWDLESAKQIRSFGAENGYVKSLAISPDGAHVASADSEGFLRIWDLENGDELWSLRCGLAQASDVAYSPDGKRLMLATRQDAPKLFGAVVLVDVEATRETSDGLRSLV